MLYLLKINISMLGLKKIQNNYQEYNINNDIEDIETADEINDTDTSSEEQTAASIL